MTVYPDTTVLLAAFFVDDYTAQWFRRLLASPHEIVIGVPVARDFAQVAQARFEISPQRIGNVLKILKRQRFVPVTPTVPEGLPDPDDAKVVGCALDAGVDCFVTGDPVLLAVESIQGMKVYSPRSSWSVLFT